MKCVIKIDLCKSKVFAESKQVSNPSIRNDVLKKLIEISKAAFPNSELAYPDGSLYNAAGDAVYYIIEKPTVAIRCSIEFMITWFHQCLPNFPECRVIIDCGRIEQLPYADRIELTGEVFEKISLIEKNLGDGSIYVTEEIIDNSDKSLVTFTLFNEYASPSGKIINVFSANYLDPRTTRDSGLIHALFVANPKAQDGRNKVIEMICIAFSREKGHISDIDSLNVWCAENNYPMLSEFQINDVLSNSEYFDSKIVDGNLTHHVNSLARNLILTAKEEFQKNRSKCIVSIKSEIKIHFGAIGQFDLQRLGDLLEDYLSAIFFEIRIMANYFTDTGQIFHNSNNLLVKYDYIIMKCFPEPTGTIFKNLKSCIMNGLRKEALNNNTFISAVFHNVLSIYYLNRTHHGRSYQVELLKKRSIYFDTNVLYSLVVRASNYHELTTYLVEELSKIGIYSKIFPYTLQEYEYNLDNVTNSFNMGGNRKRAVLLKNSWFLQEYLKNKKQYVDSIEVCRDMNSIAEGILIVENNYEEIEEKLKYIGVSLDADYEELSESLVESLWIDYRLDMAPKHWDVSQFWDFVDSTNEMSFAVKSHDMSMIYNIKKKFDNTQHDEMGKKVFLVTLDSKLLNLSDQLPFIISPRQFLEYFLPYLMLSDIPLKDSIGFPNKLLLTGLSTLLIDTDPEPLEMVINYIDNPKQIGQDIDSDCVWIKKLARSLNNQRMREALRVSKEVDINSKYELASQILLIANIDSEELNKKTTRQAREINKLQKSLKYWRAEARRKGEKNR